MRTFYFYQINDICKDLYQKFPYRLYHMLKDVYYTSKYNKPIAISSYDQMTKKFNKDFLKEYIYLKFKNNSLYHCNNYIHTISSHKEYSELMESSYSLKLKCNKNYSSFFQTLQEFNQDIFVCDFENQDYFWLNKVINNEKKFIKE